MAHKIQHFYYADGNEIVVTAIPVDSTDFTYTIRKPDGSFPICPIEGKPAPHPIEEDGRQNSPPDYVELGLYYGYEMWGW